MSIPDAPKGGTLNSTASGTFDSFNPYIVQGTPAAGLELRRRAALRYADGAGDRRAKHQPSADRRRLQISRRLFLGDYRLDPRAKWHDGTPITVDDVIWSFNVLKANSPIYNRYYANVTEAVAVSDREVEFRFDQKGNRELPHILGDLPCCRNTGGKAPTPAARSATSPSRRWSRRSAQAPTNRQLQAGIGDRLETGEGLLGRRQLPVNVGRNNFDRRATNISRTTTPNGRPSPRAASRTSRPRTASRRWATGYDFPAVKAGDVIKREFPIDLRRADAGLRDQYCAAPQFQDRRVRAGADLRLRFREHEPDAVLRALHPHQQLFRGRRARLERPAAGQGTGDPRTVQGQAAARTVHAGVQAARLRHAAGRAARTCGTPSKLFAEAGWKISRAARWSTTSGEQFKIEIPRQ